MKATEVLQRYTKGERDFREVNLRGQNFQGTNLSEADFRGADIRGTNFTDVTLKGANFTKAEAGLQRRWMMLWLGLAFISVCVSGALDALFFGVFAIYLSIDSVEIIVAGYLSLGLCFAFSLIALKRGLVAALSLAGITFVVASVGIFIVAVAVIAAIKFENLVYGIVVGIVAVLVAIAVLFTVADKIPCSGIVLATVAVIAAVMATGAVLGIGLDLVIALIVSLAAFLVGVAISFTVTNIFLAISAVTVAVPVTVTFLVAGSAAGVVAATSAVLGAVLVAGAVANILTDIFANILVGIFAIIGISVNLDIGTGIGASTVIFSALFILLNVYIAWRSLLGDPKDAWVRSVAIAVAAIGGTNFRSADLTDANFVQAQLKSTDLRRAVLTRTNWHKTTKLDCTRTSDTILVDATVRHLLITHRGQYQSFVGCNFKGANLAGADLSNADLTEADFSQATLEGAWLERANLTKVQALGTNFHMAKLTGTCLEAWNIDNTTQLDGAICEYVYLLNGQQERRPSSEHSLFAPGEFTSLFEEMLNTIDLIFRDGVDWQAFFQSFQDLRSRYNDDDIAIQAIERKKNGVCLIRLEVPAEVNKAAIEEQFKQLYEAKLKILEAQYEERLRLQGIHLEDARRTIEVERHGKSTLMGIMATMAQNQGSKYDQRGSTFGNFVDTAQPGSKVQSIQHNYASPPKQDLAEAASEIQALLEQLEQTYSVNSMSEKMTMATEAVKQIEANPSFKQKAVNALVAGGTKALESAINHPAAAFVVGAIEEWRGS